MQNLDKIVQLSTNDPAKRLVLATKYLVQINFTFDLSVADGSFAGSSRFCVRKDQIKEFSDSLLDMSEPGHTARLDDNDSDGFIEISQKDSLGHITVKAQAGGSHENHVSITFDTDQTTLPEFIKAFNQLLTYEDSERPVAST